MPVLGFSTWKIGGDTKRNPHNDDEADIAAIKTAIEKGVTHIDTAEVYAEGHVEELVGKAIQTFDRSKLFITTKVSPDHLHYQDIMQSARKSMERLQTEYVDLYLIHSPNPQIPLKETMRAMDDLVASKKVKYIGVSNFNITQISEAQSSCKNKIVANQLHYNLIVREVEQKGILQYCQNRDIMVMAFRPVERGELTQKGIEILDEMCQKYHKTPSQIAINWLISQPNVVTITKMAKTDHLNENIDATGWEMEKEDQEELRRSFPGQLAVSPNHPLY